MFASFVPEMLASPVPNWRGRRERNECPVETWCNTSALYTLNVFVLLVACPRHGLTDGQSHTRSAEALSAICSSCPDAQESKNLRNQESLVRIHPYLPIYIIHLSIHPSFHPCILPSFHHFIVCSFHPPIHPCTHPPMHPSTHPPIHPSTNPPTHPSTRAPAAAPASPAAAPAAPAARVRPPRAAAVRELGHICICTRPDICAHLRDVACTSLDVYICIRSTMSISTLYVRRDIASSFMFSAARLSQRLRGKSQRPLLFPGSCSAA